MEERIRGRKRRLLFLSSAACAFAGFLTAGYPEEREEAADTGAVVSVSVFAMREAPATPLEMALRLERELARGAGVLMPDPDTPVRLDGGVIPLDGASGGFPAGFLAGLAPEKVNGVEAWRATLRADDATGDMIFYNAGGKAFWSVEADASVYSADWVARIHSADGGSLDFSGTARMLEELAGKAAGIAVPEEALYRAAWLAARQYFLPSHVEMAFTFVLAEDLPDYRAAGAAEAAALSGGAEPLRAPAPLTGLTVTGIAAGTDGVSLSAGWPAGTVFSGGALDVFFTPSLAPAAWTNLVRAGVGPATNGLDVAVPRALLPPAPEPGPVTAVTNIVPSSYDPGVLVTNIVVTSPPVPGEVGFFRLADLADTDSDCLTDAFENWVSHTDPLDPDSDDDGLTDGEEAALGTGPLSADTDGDGLADGWEAAHGFNPLAVQADGARGAGDDPDGDGLPNLLESRSGTSPFETDTDGDGLSDGEETPGYRVAEWGQPYGGADAAPRPAGLTNIVSASAGPNHVAAVRRDGTVACWGKNGAGQCSPPAGLAGVVSVAAGASHTAAVLRDGTVRCWGGNASGQCSVPEGCTNAVAAAAGLLHTAALLGGGRVLCWGGNTHGQTSVPTGLTNAVAVAACGTHSAALTADGRVLCWGYPGVTNVPPGLTNAVAVAAGLFHAAALTADGRVVCWGGNTYGQADTPSGLGVATAVGAGQHHTLASTSAGEIVCWGDNAYGQSETNLPGAPACCLGGGVSYSLALAGHRPLFTDPLNPDTDGDGMWDGWEAAHNGFDPLAAQTDGTHGAGDDPDGDGLTNGEESTLWTAPFNFDSDGDGVTDGGEVGQGHDPLNQEDTPSAEWFTLTGDLAQDVVKTLNRSFEIPAGQSRLIVVALQSDEYPHFTGNSSEFNDILTWEVTPTSGSPLSGSVDVNSRHSAWDNGIELNGYAPVCLEGLHTLTAPSGAPVSVTVHLIAKNVSDDILPSTVMVGVMRFDLDVDSDHDGDIDAGDEAAEETDGGIVAAGVAALKPLKIACSPEVLGLGTLTLEAVSGGEKITLRSGNSTNSAAVTLPKTWASGETVPSQLWVQGLSPSDAPRDVSLQLSYSFQGETCEDTVNLTVVKADVSFADSDSPQWIELAEEKVVLSDKELRIKVKTTPGMGSLSDIFETFGNELAVKTSGTAPSGHTLVLSVQNTELIQRPDYSELHIVQTRDDLRALGVLPGSETDLIEEKAWLDTGSPDPTADSNLSDGIAFDSLAAESRGRCTSDGNLESQIENSPVHLTFFQAAGREIITAEFAEATTPKRQIMNQADYFYYSGHGFHITGGLTVGAPSAIADYWNQDLDCVVIAGCSVLDINDYNDNYTGDDHTVSPGEMWEPLGPLVLLGYNWYAPTDTQGATPIISSWLADRGTLGNVDAWRNANENSAGWNACAIIKGISYSYYKRISIGPFTWNHEWTTVLKSDW